MVRPPREHTQDRSNDWVSSLLRRGRNYARENPRKTAGAGLLLVSLSMLGDEDGSGSERSDLEIYVWDVEHGDAMLIKSPEANIVVDLGQHHNGFSPTNQIRKHGVEQVDLLAVSHPDLDHIQDITTFFDHFKPRYFMHPSGDLPYVEHRVHDLYPDDEGYQETAGRYLEERNRFRHSKDSPIRFGDLLVHEFSLTPDELGLKPPENLPQDRSPSLNNLSVLNVFEYGDFKLASMGDLESDGVELLLEKNGVVDALKGTDVLLAPHHGRQSSYSRELLELTEPDIVGVSDSGGTENSATSRYGNNASGRVVERRDGEKQTRYSITTRKDGVLYFGADPDGTYKVIID